MELSKYPQGLKSEESEKHLLTKNSDYIVITPFTVLKCPKTLLADMPSQTKLRAVPQAMQILDIQRVRLQSSATSRASA